MSENQTEAVQASKSKFDLLKNRVTVAVVAASPLLAFAEVDASSVATGLLALTAPIAVVGGARMTVNVAMRGWKLVSRMI